MQISPGILHTPATEKFEFRVITLKRDFFGFWKSLQNQKSRIFPYFRPWPKLCKANFQRFYWTPMALKPCISCRPWKKLWNGAIETSVRPNQTLFFSIVRFHFVVLLLDPYNHETMPILQISKTRFKIVVSRPLYDQIRPSVFQFYDPA